ncbi:MAG: RCC1 domain-containing protein [Puniceicoccaceae bacterium]
MKRKRCGRLLVVLAWCLTLSLLESRVWGGETVLLSQTDIQEQVYGGHLMVLMDGHPELEAGLLLLLEMDRRNPAGDPAQLEEKLLAGIVAYRDAVADHLMYTPSRDVVIACFLEELVKTVDLEGLRPATLTVLHQLIEDSYAATSGSSVRTHAGNHEVLGREHALAKRQELVETLVHRARTVTGFGELLDRFLKEETEVSLWHEPTRILELDTVLGGSPTMQWLAEQYENAASGPLEVPNVQIEQLFQQEMAIIRDTITDNQALHKELESGQAEVSAYLGDPGRVAAQLQRQTEAQEGQNERISASAAATHALSFTMRAAKPELAKHMKTVADSMSSIARGLKALNTAQKFSKLAACTDFVSAGLNIVSLFIDTGPSAEEMILEEIFALKQMIHDLATHIDYRFDRVDRTLNIVLEQLDYSIQLIGETGHDVDEVRLDLLDVQTGLCRLEREVYNYLNAGFRRTFVERLNGDLRFEARTGEPMAWEWYRDTAENTFYSWAVSHSKDELSSYWPAPEDLSDDVLEQQLQARPLECNLNYIKEFLNQRLGVPQLSSKPVPSPRDWFAGADAYLKLAVENPLHYRRMSRSRLDEVIDVGQDLERFLGAFSLTGPGEVNTVLFNAVLDYYDSRLQGFLSAVDAESAQYADQELDGFAYGMWRDWDTGSPESYLQEPAVTGGYKVLSVPEDVVEIAVGNGHSLAVRSNGTVIAWGSNYGGVCNVPPEATNVVAVAAGASHSLALRADGTVIAWGGNHYNSCEVPVGLANVVAIAAGPYHNLALRDDGTVVTWGYLTDYPEWQVPEGLTDVVGIAAGGDSNRDTGAFSLALKADGSVVAWGSNGYGECDVPEALANGELDVVQIAAKMTQGAAVLADGSIIGWPEPMSAVGEVKELAMYSWGNVVALCKDGTVEVIEGGSDGAPDTNDIVSVATGGHAMALHADGSITAWGSGSALAAGLPPERSIVSLTGNKRVLMVLLDDGSLISIPEISGMPEDLPSIAAVSLGTAYSKTWCLALTEEGTVLAWGDNSKGQCNVPEGLSDVVAISASEGGDGSHSLALKKDGTIVGWGDNSFGHRNAPAGLNDAVAIAAGWRHSLALKSNGTVVAWGNNWYGQLNIPSGLENVVAISSHHAHNLALKADGTVAAWGENGSGECNVPEGLDNVVAIEAGYDRSLALRADGTVVAWGYNDRGAVDFANSMTGVARLGYGNNYFDYFLCSNEFPCTDDSSPQAFPVRPLSSQAVSQRFAELYGYILSEFPYDLHDPARNLDGAKGLLAAVTTLALPLSMEQDDALRGFLFGAEGILDNASSQAAYEAEVAWLESSLWARPNDIEAPFRDRYSVFEDRLYGCLEEVALNGTPEVPRMVGHTLALLEILRSAHFSGSTASPVFDLRSLTTSGTDILVPLYGEPFVHYELDLTAEPDSWPQPAVPIDDGELLHLDAASPAWFFRARVP